MRRLLALAAVAALTSASCSAGPFRSLVGGNSNTRTVLVDYKHDRFASAMFDYFPNDVYVHPGDTVVFRQTWSGEPHSVTMGTEVDKLGELIKPYKKIFLEKGYKALPQEPPPDIKKIEDGLPWMVDDNGNVNQNGAEPCFLRSALPPKKSSTPCRKAQRQQPAFTGRYKFYNSGFIPYDGPNGDTYTVKISPKARSGSHFFFCNYHGEFMSGYLHIRPKKAKIPSQEDVSREAQKSISKKTEPLLREFRKAQRNKLEPPKEELDSIRKFGLVKSDGSHHYFDGHLAGLGVDGVDNAMIDEFIPKRITAKAGQKLTWLVVGSHTISFHVPKYFPIYRVAKDGKVSINSKIRPPAGGAPDISKLGEQPQNGPPEIDGGSWDGHGFWSTGLIESEDFAVYHLTITKPGTYAFACLIHPPMVGTLVVSR